MTREQKLCRSLWLFFQAIRWKESGQRGWEPVMDSSLVWCRSA